MTSFDGVRPQVVVQGRFFENTCFELLLAVGRAQEADVGTIVFGFQQE